MKGHLLAYCPTTKVTEAISGPAISLAPGRWILMLKSHGHTSESRRALTTFTVSSGSTQRVEFSIPGLELGTISALITHRSQPLPHAWVELKSKEGPWTYGTRADARGRFRCENLPTGWYAIRVIDHIVRGVTSNRTLHMASVRVGPGSRRDVTVRSATTSASIHVVDSKGNPMTRRWINVADFGPVQTDANGNAVLTPAPPAPLQVSTIPRPGQDPMKGRSPNDWNGTGTATVRMVR